MGNGLNDSGVERDFQSLVRAAETKIELLAQDFEVWAGEDLNDAKQALDAATVMPAGRQPQIQKIFDIAHNMKGIGGTFGYDLITLVGQSLCDFIRHIPDATDSELKVIDHHLAVMAVVFDERIKGSGGQFADKITSKLKHITAASQGDLVL